MTAGSLISVVNGSLAESSTRLSSASTPGRCSRRDPGNRPGIRRRRGSLGLWGRGPRVGPATFGLQIPGAVLKQTGRRCLHARSWRRLTLHDALDNHRNRADMCDSRLIAPYPREPLTHCAWSRRQGVRAGNLSYLDPMFFRAGRLVDRMSSSSLDSRPRIMQFIASLEQQLAVRITTRSRKSSKKKALSRLFSWTAATDTRTVQPSAGEPRPPCERPIRRGRNACFDSSSRAGSPSCRRACAFCGPSRFIENRPDSLHREDLLVTPGNGRTIVSMMPRTGWALLWVAFPFVVVACSNACLLKAADPASGVTPAADPPAVLPPPIAGRAAISPAAPIIPGETVAALQDGNH